VRAALENPWRTLRLDAADARVVERQGTFISAQDVALNSP